MATSNSTQQCLLSVTCQYKHNNVELIHTCLKKGSSSWVQLVSIGAAQVLLQLPLVIGFNLLEGAEYGLVCTHTSRSWTDSCERKCMWCGVPMCAWCGVPMCVWCDVFMCVWCGVLMCVVVCPRVCGVVCVYANMWAYKCVCTRMPLTWAMSSSCSACCSSEDAFFLWYSICIILVLSVGLQVWQKWP